RTALVERPELSISDVTGDWQNMDCYYGMESPLPELSAAMKGYGHANFRNDFDNVYRRQALIAKLSVPVSVMPVAELTADSAADESVYRRFGWTDTAGFEHYLKVPADEKELAAVIKKIQAGSPSGNVTLYQDYFIPSVTLARAVNQVGGSFSDISVKVGESITIRTDKRELKIPVDDNCQMLINYAGAPGTFQVRSYSAYTSTKPLDEPDKWPATKALGNKIVMVGAYAQGMAEDQKLTPYGLMYGVEIHANALNTILQENFIHNVPVWIDILILAVFIFMTALVVCRFFPLISFLISVLVIAVLFFVQSFVFDRCHYLFPFTPVALGIFLTFISVVLYRVINGEKDKKMIRNMFGKYVCPEFVDQMIEEGKSPELGGVDKDITVLFSDIRGFTSMSEKMTPQELVKHLNEYLTAMTDIIIDYYGTLDKYVGDEIMCFWGAPVDVADHALLACKCALKQMEVLHRINESWPPEKRINIGIGINSGIMTVGNMGSAGRMNYTLMGDNVNLGARLEGTNKEYGTNIIISEYTYEKVKDHVVVRELDNIRVKGKNKPVVIYELLDVVGGYDKN
ncbi:MAG: adenylate/guanylate cyclase domain-containing protein, partial [Spirochaetia bacterium]|nr:adenylate/guanylate cyclase domain-containing protein [Spirochaetia bacterium]